MKTNPALNALRYHVTGAIERGEAKAIEAIDPSPIARWQTKGHDWLELYRDERNYAPDKGRFSYTYRGSGCGGGFVANSDEEAVSRMENPWGHPEGAGQAFVLKCDRPSLKRVFPKGI